MSTPLTDSIENLTTYINGITGVSDDNLSDAVATLADGYGSGGIGIDDWVTGNEPSGVIYTNATTMAQQRGSGTKITEFHAPNLLLIPLNAFSNTPALRVVDCPKATGVASNSFYNHETCCSIIYRVS